MNAVMDTANRVQQGDLSDVEALLVAPGYRLEYDVHRTGAASLSEFGRASECGRSLYAARFQSPGTRPRHLRNLGRYHERARRICAASEYRARPTAGQQWRTPRARGEFRICAKQ